MSSCVTSSDSVYTGVSGRLVPLFGEGGPPLTRITASKTTAGRAIRRIEPPPLFHRADLFHDPAVDVGEHIHGDFLAAGILAERDVEAGGVEQTQVAADLLGRVFAAVA